MERKRAGAGRGRGAETGSEMRSSGKTRWGGGRRGARGLRGSRRRARSKPAEDGLLLPPIQRPLCPPLRPRRNAHAPPPRAVTVDPLIGDKAVYCL